MSEQLEQLSKIFRFRILNHFLFWVSVVFVTAYNGSIFGGSLYENFINMLVLCPIQMIAAYALVYYQFPRLFLRGKWILFLIHLMVTAYATSILARVFTIYIAEPLVGRIGIDESLWEIISDPLYLVQVYTIIVYIPAVILFLIKMTSERFKQENQVQVLQSEKRQMELSFLKAQMNPHFLFNTLNNIYSLALTQSDDTPEMILKLSEILDYTIYHCQEKFVPVQREWNLIESYADLQAMRSKVPLKLILENNIDDSTAEIAPLIIISLVENAFKYSMRGKHPEIKIELRVINGALTLEIYNTKPRIPPVDNIKSQTGIGINNVKSQLALIYPNRHKIDIIESTETYHVTLNIVL